MYLFVSALMLCAGVSFVSADRICCKEVGCFYDDDPFDHLPLPQCPDELAISTRVFTRQNPTVGQKLSRTTIPDVFDPMRKTLFIVHGWMSNAGKEWVSRIRAALLKKADYNVVTVDWDSSDLDYPQSAANTRVVGAEIDLRVQLLVNERDADRDDVICVGHSLGAHACGFAGKRRPLGRITGLDPAGPWFEDYAAEAGLQKTDAIFVDVIHTNGEASIALALGMLRPMGHVDFYPNGGGRQPGCYVDSLHSTSDVSQYDLSPACSHSRATDLYEESITNNRCKFDSAYVCTDPRNIPGSCKRCGHRYCQTMGIEAVNRSARGLFYLETSDEYPFCLTGV